MTLEEKSIQVTQLYLRLDLVLQEYQKSTGLSCTKGCSACCKSPQVESTILELLPLAFHLYKENEAELFYENLTNNHSPICALFRPLQPTNRQGGCDSYPHRALICRLFGFSFTSNKFGKPVPISCKEIKEKNTEAFEKSIKAVYEGAEAPMANDYQNQLNAIDPNLSQEFHPINKAMKLALEMVMTHFHYTAEERSIIKNAS